MTAKAVCVLIVIASLEKGLSTSYFNCDNTDICVTGGTNVTCTCTVEDESSNSLTLWDGSAFTSQCPEVGDRIAVPHSVFTVGMVSKCGDRISVLSISQEFSNYTSNATITVNTSNNGSSVRCSVGGPPPVGAAILNVGEIPPRPSNLDIPMESLTRERFSLAWIEPVNVFGGVGSYQVNVRSDLEGHITRLCGHMIAPNGDAGTVRNFTDWIIEGQTCYFSVTTVTGDNCNFTSTPSEEVSITLQGPSSANVEQVSLSNPVYTGNLLSTIDISFTYRQESPVNVTDAVTSITTNFSISYRYSAGGGCTTIVPLSCDLSLCNYSLSLDNCSAMASGNVTFSVIPLNIIGSGNQTNSDAIESMNPLFTITDVSSVNSPNVSLQLRFPMTFTSANCNLVYGLGAGCGNLTLNRNVMQASSNIIFVNFTLSSIGTYCYQISCGVIPDTAFPLTPIAQGIINYQSGGGSDSGGGGASVTQFPPWAIAIIVVALLGGAGAGGGVVIVLAVKKPWKKVSNETKSSDESADGHGLQLVSNPDDKFYADPSSIGHEQAPTGDEYAMVDTAGKKKQALADDEYAVVEKPSKKAKSTDGTTNQALYQDPGSIDHEQAPTGDFYAMPQQKRKKGKTQESSADPASTDMAAMYSTVDTSKKKNQLTYAQLDVGSGSGGIPSPQSTSYATVVS